MSRDPVVRPLEERFWAKVDRRGTDECWPWKASRFHFGHGRITETGHRGRSLVASRVAWELAYGPIPEGLMVRHRCDNPPCVNVAHLELGTQKDNVHDCHERGRAAMNLTFDRAREANGRAKLSEVQVAQIRERITNGGTQRGVAAEFGVSKSLVGCIVRGENWAG